MTDHWVMTDADVRHLLGVLERPVAAAADDIFYADVLTGLRELIPSHQIVFQLADVAHWRGTLLFVDDRGLQREETDGVVRNEFDQLWRQEYWEVGGFAGPLATGDYTTLLVQSQLCSPRRWADTPMGSAFKAEGIKDHLLVPMRPLGGVDRRLGIFRSSDMPDFSERELAMLALARPRLAELAARRERERRTEPHLTPRQWDVLRQVAKGAGNTQIARSLGMSERTVAKHLENVFVRLGVQSRTEAVASVLTFLDVV